MAVVRLRQPLKRLAGDADEHRLEATTISAALQELEQSQPDLRGWILDERGALRRHINVFVNGEPAEVGASVGPDDRIDVLPAISGGDS